MSSTESVAAAALALSATALTVAFVVFIFTILLQTYSAILDELHAFDKSVMGPWAKDTRLKPRLHQLSVDIEYRTPVIFLAPSDNERGPLPDQEIWYADGTPDSYTQTGTAPNEVNTAAVVNEKELDPEHSGPGRTRLSTLQDGERATWVNLLIAVQKMEKESTQWEDRRWRDCQEGKPRPLLQEVVSLAVGIQQKKSRFHRHAAIKRPYATSTISHVIELAAMLGLYWKEFDRDLNRYRAEGNGYSLYGNRQDFGIVFRFERMGWSHFESTRVIPTSEVKELCFGNVPTLYRPRDRIVDRAWEVPFKQRSLETLQLGSFDDMAKTLRLIGCTSETAIYLSNTRNPGHLFPVIFEVVGMLGRTMHIRDRCFTYLPNPTIFRWDNRFSRLRLLRAFTKLLKKEDEGHSRLSEDVNQVPMDRQRVLTLALGLMNHLPRERRSFSPIDLNLLHETIDDVDIILSKLRNHKDAVLDIVRRHIQAIVHFLDRSPSGEDEDNSLRLLLSTPPEDRERKFMKTYFEEILPDATKVGAKEDVVQSDDSDLDEEEILDDPGELGGESYVWRGNMSPLELETERTVKSRSNFDNAPPVRLPSRATFKTGVNELKRQSVLDQVRAQRKVIWYALVFRMICWLLLHDFDEDDVQVSKSELLGSRLPVYIV